MRYYLCLLAVVSMAVLVALAGPSMLADSKRPAATIPAATIPNQGVDNSYGSSGGNINDISRRFCCSGTLGSLVTDGNADYILSNNHVLADSDQGHVGDEISQPGLVDVGCVASNARIVATLTAWPALGSNVDAALALLTGFMNNSDTIDGIGVPSSVVRTPAVGLSVQKSGRTTGVTTGSVQSINTSVNVKYTTTCGGHKGFVISYANQVVVTPGSFSAGGDSGSLIVTNDSACPQPVALLFAGSSTTTIGNPIGEVLSKTMTALGKSISFRGPNCGTATSSQPRIDSSAGQMPGISELAVSGATAAMRTRERDIMGRPGVLGIGIGASAVNSTEAVIKVYVDELLGSSTSLPRRINGFKVERIITDAFVAY
jgi:hypothetical protein